MVFQLCVLSFPFSRKHRFRWETFLKSRAIRYLLAIIVKWFGGIGKWGNNEQIDDTYCLSNRGRSIFFFFSSKTSNLFVFQEISKSRSSFIFDFVSSRNTNGFHRIQFSLSMESATR